MATKKQKKATGCRKCKYRVSIPVGDKREPKCCFGFKIDDKKLPDCSLFTESDYYETHPDEI